MPEEIVYGVCLPATGFSALFVLVSLLTVISVLVSGWSAGGVESMEAAPEQHRTIRIQT